MEPADAQMMQRSAEHEQFIRDVAYRLWRERGRRDGHALQDWLDAERLVDGRGAPEPPIKVANPPEVEVDTVEPEITKVASRDAPGG